ncbi:MAG: amino acid adenylation domain-containing protein [Desulfobacterales bacterium]|nr:amino acid adenylation domain-containing protein [Desulfobacterales bacterium]
MGISKLILELHKLNIKIWAEGDELCFKAPKGTITEEIRNKLSFHKNELILFLDFTKKKRSFDTKIQPVPRGKTPLPLSYSQKRLWFLDQLEGQSHVYNICGAVKLIGKLDISVFERAFNEIIRRHEILRTSFLTVDGQPVQNISHEFKLSIPVLNMEELSKYEQDKEIKLKMFEHAQNDFNLSKIPLIKAELLCISPNENILLITIHHIISDGWSSEIIIKEASVLYDAYISGKQSPLNELSIQYADYAVWQINSLSGETFEKQITYWKNHLKGAPSLLELPTDKPRPPLQTFNGNTKIFEIDRDITKKLQNISRESETSLFMVLYAAFSILLYKYSGQEDIVIGSPIANRHYKEIEPLIGFFVNTLALRTNLSGNPTFREVLKQVQQVIFDAHCNQDLPFEYLVEAIKPERSLSHSPLFQVMFVLQNAPVENIFSSNLIMIPLEESYPVSKFDLTLSIEETKEKMIGSFEYNTDLFLYETIELMSEHFMVLLNGIIDAPNQSIGKLNILTDKELKQFEKWNDTKVVYPKDKTIVDLFEEQANKTPDAISVIYEDKKLTYIELNEKSNQIADYLINEGVCPDILVGISGKRSLEMIIGLLGILKSGGAYVPIDPSYPKERTIFTISDSKIDIVLTQNKIKEILSSHPLLNQSKKALPNHLAYVIYTSGSTGKPKGVMIRHHELANHCRNIVFFYQLSPKDRILQFASINFDTSAEQIFSALIAGSALVLRGNDIWSYKEFLENISKYQISVLDVPPSYLNHLLEDPDNRSKIAKLYSLRIIVTGGEEFPLRIFHLWQHMNLKSVRLLNAYGPTETTITATIFEIPHDEIKSLNIPIGLPLANRKIYILDKEKNIVPVGVHGEIHIGGEGLSVGYLNQTELTERQFISNPFSHDPNDKIYKTGDLGKFLPDGNIEYIGRIDNQIKLRGFRIELGEIEAALVSHPNVTETAVILCNDSLNQKHLVAYLVLNRVIDNSKELPNFLKSKLPDYMIPDSFVVLDKLPITANGKIDRNNLPKPDNFGIVSSYVAPQTETEKLLSDMWKEILDRKQVGIYDNFFEIGGHSMSATVMISRLRKKNDMDVRVRKLFEYPVLKEFAEYIDTIRDILQKKQKISDNINEFEEIEI